MITLKSCPNCNSNLITQYQTLTGGNLICEIIPGVKVNAVPLIHYSVCQDCNLIFQNPRLSDVELDVFYGSDLYRRTVKQPSEGMDKAEENRSKVNTEIIKHQIGKVRRHLDVGCGRGYLLKAVDADTKVGVELDKSFVKVRGVKVYSRINQVPAKKFDLVSAIHVLEHVPYPINFLRDLGKFVGKNGHLVVEVPSRKIRGGPFGFYHLSYFEPDVLKLMCLEVGMKVVAIEFTPNLVLICEAG